MCDNVTSRSRWDCNNQNNHRTSSTPIFWPKLYPISTICTRIDLQLQICHEIVCKAVVFEKNLTAWIEASGIEVYGAHQDLLWCCSLARRYATRRHNGFSTPNLLRVPGKKLGLGVGLGGEEKQGEIRSQLKAAPPHY